MRTHSTHQPLAGLLPLATEIATNGFLLADGTVVHQRAVGFSERTGSPQFEPLPCGDLDSSHNQIVARPGKTFISFYVSLGHLYTAFELALGTPMADVDDLYVYVLDKVAPLAQLPAGADPLTRREVKGVLLKLAHFGPRLGRAPVTDTRSRACLAGILEAFPTLAHYDRGDLARAHQLNNVRTRTALAGARAALCDQMPGQVAAVVMSPSAVVCEVAPGHVLTAQRVVETYARELRGTVPVRLKFAGPSTAAAQLS